MNEVISEDRDLLPNSLVLGGIIVFELSVIIWVLLFILDELGDHKHHQGHCCKRPEAEDHGDPK